MKKVSLDIRAYVRARIVDFKSKGYDVKGISELLNINVDYVYQVLKKYCQNATSLPIEKVHGRKVG